PLLLEGPKADESRIKGAGKRLLRAYTNVSMAYYLADRAMQAGGSDEVVLGNMMAEVRTMVINPRRADQIRHSTAVWPALLSGVGYCDQLNAIVCRMAAHHFSKAELIALYLPDGQMSPHTVGRVWSKERNDWLYFDAFYKNPVIFTRAPNGSPRFLSTYAGDVMPTRESVSPTIYGLQGWKLSDFRSTFGMYLFDRVLMRDSESVAEMPAAKPTRPQTSPNVFPTPVATATNGAILAARPAELITEQVSPTGDRVPVRQCDVFRSVTRAYAAARVSHLFGRPDRNAYRAVAKQSRMADRDDRAAEIANAAARFAALAK
ncbi:MAG TPA: hypothetical protein VF608_01575, partial [Thermoanaerobaculia bacterium]